MKGLARRLIVAGGQQQQVAGLQAIKVLDLQPLFGRRDGRVVPALQDPVDQLCNTQRENGVHVVPKLPLG
jgi:hypothetical protein